jgi:hypothetical protein
VHLAAGSALHSVRAAILGKEAFVGSNVQGGAGRGGKGRVLFCPLLSLSPKEMRILKGREWKLLQ